MLYYKREQLTSVTHIIIFEKSHSINKQPLFQFSIVYVFNAVFYKM